MIKTWRVKATDNIIKSGEIRRSGRKFTIGEEYICIQKSFKCVKIYDDNDNTLELCSPDRCGFGQFYPIYTKYFDIVPNSTKYCKNKQEFRKERLKYNNAHKYKIGDYIYPRKNPEIVGRIVDVNRKFYSIEWIEHSIVKNTIVNQPKYIVDVYYNKRR